MTRIATTLLIALLIALFLGSHALAAQQTTKLELFPRPGQSALVTTEATIEGNIVREVKGKAKKEKLKIVRRFEALDLIDNCQRDERNALLLEGRRRYLRYEIDENKERLDTPLGGTLLALRHTPDRKIDIKPQGGRAMGQEDYDAEFQRLVGLGLTPAIDLEVGDEPRRWDARVLAPFLLGETSKLDEATMDLAILERDDEKGRLTIGGPLRASASERANGRDMGWKYEVETRMVIDLQAKRIIAASSKGRVTSSGYERDDKLDFEGEIDCKIEVDAKPNVDKELKREVKIRSRHFQAGNTGIYFEVPASYFANGLDESAGYVFFSVENGDASRRQLAFKFERMADPKKAIDEQFLPHKGHGAKVENVSFKGGRGSSVSQPTQDHKSIQVMEQYAVKGGRVQILFFYPASLGEDGMKELKAIRKTIRFEP
ncbi:MAG: hypothetical protein H6807_07820 [Planctomycetes bacterium]|nr:hypothetical protein [Planctomycetota bacterium]